MRIYLLVEGVRKSLEKSLRPEITLGHRATQEISLSILQSPGGSSVTAGREQAEGVSVCRGFQCRAPLGFWCQILAVLEQVLVLFMIFTYSSCSAGHGHGQGVYLQKLFSALGSSLKQNTGLFVDLLLTISLLLTSLQRQAPQTVFTTWNFCMGPTSRKLQSLPWGQEAE